MMYQTTIPYLRNSGMFQVNDLQSIKTEHVTNPQQPFQQPSPKILPALPGNGTLTPPMCLPDRMLSATVGSQVRNLGIGQANVTCSDPYSCNFLAQLEGNYVTETAEADQIQVELVDGAHRYAVVRRTSKAGEPVAEQQINEDDTRFTLCSSDGFVLAVMAKGRDMKHSVSWYANDGSQYKWRRTGDVSFKLVAITPGQSRRNSITSNFSGISQLSHSSITDERMQVRPEIPIRPELNPLTAASQGQPQSFAAEGLTNTSSESLIPECASASRSEHRLSDDELFEQFLKLCAKCPSVVQKIVNWGISRTPSRRVGDREISDLANGRLWVRATVVRQGRGNIDKWQEAVSEFKGAYQEVEQGIYVQPSSQPDEPGKQHRLRKSNFGFWMIEEHNVEDDKWYACVQELPYGHWVDLKDNRRRYNIRLVSMLSVLNRMRDKWADFEEMEKSMEFLFNSCNQKKLNTRLKARNLKHNISNLRLKLEKQYALSFAIRVAELADSIALDGHDVSLSEIREPSS
jgi:hypothetical protein